MKITCDVQDRVDFRDIKPFQGELKSLSEENFNRLDKSIKDNGFFVPIGVWENEDTLWCLDGHQRLLYLERQANKGIEIPNIPIFRVQADNLKQAKKKLLQLVSQFGRVEKQGMYEFMIENEIDLDDLHDLDLPNFNVEEFKMEFFGEPENSENEDREIINLSDKFGAPPFSILDAKQGYWQDRKRKWLSLGIKSENGRDQAPSGSKMLASYENGVRKTGLVVDSDTSIFDPTLCEIIYRWFSAEEDLIVDPFAGGSVRGLVASLSQRKYIGIDLRDKQVISNREQENIADQNNVPVWVCGDSLDMPIIIKDAKADLIFSCPPYADLEVYSDDDRDISNMPYPNFITAYRKIIKNCYDILNEDRFACFVIGEVRSSKGEYYNFLGDTISAFKDSGFKYYNEMILSTAVGSAALRAGKQFKSGRKIAKTHQNVLIFYKGEWKKAVDRLGDVYVPELSDGVSADQ